MWFVLVFIVVILVIKELGGVERGRRWGIESFWFGFGCSIVGVLLFWFRINRCRDVLVCNGGELEF